MSWRLSCHHQISRGRVLRCRSFALGQRGVSQVGLDDPEVWEQLLGLFVVDTGMDNDIVARDPIDRSGDLVLVARLERIHDSKYLGRVAAGRGRIRQNQSNGLFGINDENRANGECNALLVDIGGILVVDPAHSVSVHIM